MRIQLRIVAGVLRGRKLHCTLHGQVRPTPQMVREALFSILGDAVPDRPFVDIFGGTGAVGLEALSRGASQVQFIERDVRLAGEIEQHLRAFDVADRARVLRADAYRWAERWEAPGEPVNIFVSPPFRDFEQRLDALLLMTADLQRKVAAGSVLVVQAEKGFPAERLPESDQWERRTYGRNELLIWVKEAPPTNDGTDRP
jgi:16S rRNA (guanine(966)-N(2))-methyltransferase RsmD